MEDVYCPSCSCKMEIQDEYDECCDEDVLRRGCNCGYEDLCTEEGDIIKVISESEVYKKPFLNISYSDIFKDQPKMTQDEFHNLISLAHPQEP